MRNAFPKAVAAGALMVTVSSAYAQAEVAVKTLPDWLINSILFGMTIVWVFALLMIMKALRKQDWDLSKALSEEAQLPAGTPTPAAGQLPPTLPSTSRLIALIGTVILGTFFLGVGYYVIWQLCNGQPITAANNAWAFFATGSTLFLPYGLNKVTSILK
jgi:hypothetical protein